MEAKRKYMWICVCCGQAHESEEDAISCCTPDEVYKCPGCGKVYPGQESAAACCMEKKEMWMCNDCGEGHVVKADAVACCCCNNGLADEGDSDEEEDD
jgi:hypothetical protein